MKGAVFLSPVPHITLSANHVVSRFNAASGTMVHAIHMKRFGHKEARDDQYVLALISTIFDDIGVVLSETGELWMGVPNYGAQMRSLKSLRHAYRIPKKTSSLIMGMVMNPPVYGVNPLVASSSDDPKTVEFSLEEEKDLYRPWLSELSRRIRGAYVSARDNGITNGDSGAMITGMQYACQLTIRTLGEPQTNPRLEALDAAVRVVLAGAVDDYIMERMQRNGTPPRRR